jgi:hypothetical protein
VNAIRDKIKESADVILKRPWERVEQMQSQAQKDKASIETQVGKLDCQVTELREIVLSHSNDSVPHGPSSNIESTISEPHMNTNAATCFSTGWVNGSVGRSVNFVNPTDRPPIANSGLSSTELPLPLFDENLDVNPMFYLKQLTEFIKLKGIPHAHQLAVASKSIVGRLSRQWLEAISDKLKDYDDFQQAFLATWWSQSQQSIVRCNIYQSRYDRRSGLTLSGHFLKYATMASHLEPRLSDIEQIEIIRYHFPLQVQRVMLGTQLHSIGEALDLLKRIELVEESDSFHNRTNNYAATPNTNNNNNNDRQGPSRDHYGRNRAQGQVRQIQRYNPHDQNQHYQPRRDRYDYSRREASDDEQYRSPHRRSVPERAQVGESPRGGRTQDMENRQ